jgi:hypothetical protein
MKFSGHLRVIPCQVNEWKNPTISDFIHLTWNDPYWELQNWIKKRIKILGKNWGTEHSKGNKTVQWGLGLRTPLFTNKYSEQKPIGLRTVSRITNTIWQQRQTESISAGVSCTPSSPPYTYIVNSPPYRCSKIKLIFVYILSV